MVSKEMSSQARRRLVSDLKKIQKEPTFGIIATPCENNIMLWHCWVFGFVVFCFVLFCFLFFCCWGGGYYSFLLLLMVPLLLFLP